MRRKQFSSLREEGEDDEEWALKAANNLYRVNFPTENKSLRVKAASEAEAFRKTFRLLFGNNAVITNVNTRVDGAGLVWVLKDNSAVASIQKVSRKEIAEKWLARCVVIYLIGMLLYIYLPTDEIVAKFNHGNETASTMTTGLMNTDDNLEQWHPGNSVERVIEANSGDWGIVLFQVYNLSDRFTIPASIVQRLGKDEAISRFHEIVDVYCYWVEGNHYSYKSEENEDGSITIIEKLSYAYDAYTRQREFEKNATAILMETIGLSQREQLLKINAWLVENVTYDTYKHYSDGQSAYAAIVTRHSVCAGYSKAFQLLATALGIESYYISGLADNGTGNDNHAWNMIVTDGKESFFDVTWNDPVRPWYSYILDPGHNTNSHKMDYAFISAEKISADHSDGVVRGDFRL